jgi:CTP:molybdopterin cytidylyltransferase MocA
MENDPVFVLLAGGKSKRMGLAKGLLKYQHTFWILEQLNRISKTSIKTVYIGLGYNYQHYFDAISWLEKAQNEFVEYLTLRVKVILNSNPELGSFSTLQTVLTKIDTRSDIMVNPIDVPVLPSEEFHKILAAKNKVVIPSFKGKKGHPIKINYSFLKQLLILHVIDENARLDYQIKKLDPAEISVVEVDNKSILINMNTGKDWITFLKESV